MLPGTDKAVVNENVRSLKKSGMSERDAVMTSLRRSKKDSKKMSPTTQPSSPHEDYPYGTRMELDHETLKKMGVKKLPKTGTKVKISGHAHVKDTSEHSSDGGEPRRSMSLQMTHMCMK